jgi:hypothetical protein
LSPLYRVGLPTNHFALQRPCRRCPTPAPEVRRLKVPAAQVRLFPSLHMGVLNAWLASRCTTRCFGDGVCLRPPHAPCFGFSRFKKREGSPRWPRAHKSPRFPAAPSRAQTAPVPVLSMVLWPAPCHRACAVCGVPHPEPVAILLVFSGFFRATVRVTAPLPPRMQRPQPCPPHYIVLFTVCCVCCWRLLCRFEALTTPRRPG